jgi:glutamate racemase
VLGCTHYPLLKALIKDITGPKVNLIDSAESMADITASLLTEKNLRSFDINQPQHQFYVTDLPLRFQGIAERFLGRALPRVEHIKW